MEEENGYPIVLETMEESSDNLLNLRNESCEMVLNVQIANDTRELNRRDAEMKSNVKRITFLDEQAQKSEAQLDEINSKWDDIVKSNDAIDINNACETQRSKYMEVFECKNKIIETLKKELCKADEKFVTDQKLQKQDISILCCRIKNQLEIMKNAYRRHLDLIEETIERERKLLLYRKHQDFISLNESYAEQQQVSLDETFNVVEEYERNISDMMSEHYEKYRSIKKRLDMEVQTMHIELEKTKSACLLNERKLEYNYLVLNKRHEELGKIKATQRRRINKLKDIFNEIQNKKYLCEKTHVCDVEKCEKSIADLRLNTEAVNEKICRTDDINENTYRKIWKFNEKRSRMFLKKIYDIDKYIHENHFRCKWECPPLHDVKITELPSVQFALRHFPNFCLSDEDSSETSLKNIEPIDELENSHILRFILRNIAVSVEFLISDRIESLTENLTEEKKWIIRFDNTLKVLQISNKTDLNLLQNHFTPHIVCLTCRNYNETGDREQFSSSKSRYYSSLAAKKRTGSGNLLVRRAHFTKRPLSARAGSKSKLNNDEMKKVCENPQHSWFIDQLSVIKLLTDFIKDVKSNKRKKLKDEPLQKVLLSRVLSSKDVVVFWNKFRSNYIDDRSTLWKALLPCLSNYHSLLQENNNLESEVQQVLQQNSELNKALKNFTTKFPRLDEI